MQKEILGMRNHNKRLMSKMKVKTGCSRDVWGESLPDGWYLLLHHHVSQMVVMLGQNKSLDDRLSDLKGKKNAKIILRLWRIDDVHSCGGGSGQATHLLQVFGY